MWEYEIELFMLTNQNKAITEIKLNRSNYPLIEWKSETFP